MPEPLCGGAYRHAHAFPPPDIRLPQLFVGLLLVDDEVQRVPLRPAALQDLYIRRVSCAVSDGDPLPVEVQYLLACETPLDDALLSEVIPDEEYPGVLPEELNLGKEPVPVTVHDEIGLHVIKVLRVIYNDQLGAEILPA